MKRLFSMRRAAARPFTSVPTRPRDAATNEYPRRHRPGSHGPTSGGRRLSPGADAVEKGNPSNA